jgi:O-antigen/teichoic acid export membrane protein
VSLLKKNIAANFTGSLWMGLMALVFVPLYIKFLGIEAYGLIGVFGILQALFGLLDFGLSNTLNREMARLSVLPGKSQEMRNLLRTLEAPYWGVGLLIGAIVWVAAPLIVHHWLRLSALSPASVQLAIMIMGVAMGLQWPLSLYSGGLLGLQKQVLMNVINAGMATCQGLGAVLILWLWSATIEAFFAWQIVIGALQTGLVVFFLWRHLPPSPQKPRFQKSLLGGIWRFAAGTSGIGVLAMILTQMDKVILSRMLSLEMFGYYSLASMIAFNLYRLITPTSTATYPRFTNLFALGDWEQLTRLYHQTAQLVSVLILPAACILACFSKDVIWLWTQNPVIAERTYLLASILVMGTALNGLMNIPFILQLASGWTSLTFYASLAAVILLTPLTIFMTKWFGGVGAAMVWVIFNSGYILIIIPIMHRRLLPSEKLRWYKEDIGVPFAIALLVAVICRVFIPSSGHMIFILSWLAIASMITLVATAFATSTTRNFLSVKIASFRAMHGIYKSNDIV